VLTRITTSCNRAEEESFPLPIKTSKTLLPLSPSALFCFFPSLLARVARFCRGMVVEDAGYILLFHVQLLGNLGYRFSGPVQDNDCALLAWHCKLPLCEILPFLTAHYALRFTLQRRDDFY
jgi:hypothetical protein